LQTNVKKLVRELDDKGLDAFLAGANARYFAGTTAASWVIISRQGATLICNRLELERAKREGKIRDIREYPSPKSKGKKSEVSTLQVFAECFQEIGARAIGFDKMSSTALRKLRGIYPASYFELPELIRRLRAVKSAEEIGYLRGAAKLAVRGMKRAAELMEPGRSELEIAAEIEYAMRKHGSEGTSFGTIVASGVNSYLPHATVSEKRLRKGELVVVDLGATCRGYASDMTRTFPVYPTRKQLKLLEVVKRAQQSAIAKVRSGVRASNIHLTAYRSVARAGYGKFYLHGTGHGIGLEIHELPNLTENSRDMLRPGMVLTVEPGIYVPKVGGVRVEDDLLVTRNGSEILTTNLKVSESNLK
jgi:Xaa-Pro aminopeptidase